ncbi:hypothetical protein PG987_014253 [Apiospora arundinis]
MHLTGFATLLPVLASVAGANPVSKPTKQPCASDLKVDLKDGVVHGKVDSATPGVREFLGIPYAQPPLGDLRFAPPQPLAEPYGELDATKTPASCIQYATKLPNIYNQIVPEYLPGGANSPGPISEDCLTASVWAPRGTKKKNLPVLIWIFGGSFQYGGVDIPYFDPSQWVQRTQSHIVVEFNYRLNIFGYPDAAGLAFDAENPGLLDQRAAVEWVRDNIAAFGGDPKRIGLWGQSAGGISVGTYAYAYPTDPIVNTFLMDSGSEFLPPSFLYVATADSTAHSNFTFVASNVGCGGLSPAAELACMRKVDALKIEGFLQQYQDSLTQPPLTFTPVVDGRTLFGDYNARALAGKIAKVPTLVGSATQDGIPFVPYSPNGPNATLSDAVGFAYFFCPAYKSATVRLAQGIPVYRYLYSGNFTNVSPRPWLGAYHESELPQIFGTAPLYRGNSTAFEYQVSHLMQDSWLDFVANNGDPNAMSSLVGWPEYTSVDTGLVRDFAPADGVVATSVSLRALEKLCPAEDQPN